MTVKKFTLAMGAALALTSSNANAWFFFFIPGSVTSKIGDVLSGAEGENCVAASAKIGDVITSPSGNTATIKSLSGTTSRCQNPNLPVRALLGFQYNFSSKAGLEIPEGYEQRSLTDTLRFQGFILKAENPSKRTVFLVNTRKRDAKTDPKAIMHSISENMARMVDDPKMGSEEELTINGMKALRFEMTGKNKGIFGPTYTYLVTTLVGTNELLTINAYAPVDGYPNEKEGLAQLAAGVKGLLDPVDASTLAETPVPAVTAVDQLPGAAPVTPTAPVVQAQTATHAPISAAPLPAPAPVPAQAIPIASAPATDTGGNSTDLTVKKLRELDKLHKDGILNKSEYDDKKKELLKAL
jgi:hypothetical protein